MHTSENCLEGRLAEGSGLGAIEACGVRNMSIDGKCPLIEVSDFDYTL